LRKEGKRYRKNVQNAIHCSKLTAKEYAKMLKRSISRRGFLRMSAAGSLAMMFMPRFRALAQSRPDWLEAASAYSGQSIFGLAPASEWGRINKTLAEEFAELTEIDVAMDLTPGADPYWAKVQAEILGRSEYPFVAVGHCLWPICRWRRI
jgi:hypothetical protein